MVVVSELHSDCHYTFVMERTVMTVSLRNLTRAPSTVYTSNTSVMMAIWCVVAFKFDSSAM